MDWFERFTGLCETTQDDIRGAVDRNRLDPQRDPRAAIQLRHDLGNHVGFGFAQSRGPNSPSRHMLPSRPYTGAEALRLRSGRRGGNA